jgi:hypothetical protein
MNQRIRELMDEAIEFRLDPDSKHYEAQVSPEELEMFAESIVRDCLNIAKNWDDQLVNANLVKESNAVGIVAYRIARQFGVEE